MNHHRPLDPDDLGALSPWAGQLAKTFVSLASDIALVVDAGGVITTVEQSDREPIAPGAAQWVGRPWIETVSGETRRKIELLLQEVTSTGSARRREVNHVVGVGSGVPVAYTAIRLGADGPVLAVGRDLRAIAAIQQRFLNNQQELERGYWRVREAETRERRLHQVATDAMFVVDAPTLAIVRVGELPPGLFAPETGPLANRPLADLFEAHSRGPLDELLVTARTIGRPVELRARIGGNHASVTVAATPFREGDEQRLLVRVRGAVESPVSPAEWVLICDGGGRLSACSPRIVDAVGATSEESLHGRDAVAVLGADPQAFAALLADVRREGLSTAALQLRGADRRARTMRACATLLTEGDQEGIGLVFVPASAAGRAGGGVAPADALVHRLGEVPLRELLLHAQRDAERQLIDAALQRAAGDERAAAALLGLSHDSLRRRRRRRAPRRDGQRPAATEGARDES